ncbi:MAG: FtsX-like permease family protein [candidate division WOR-3 bacterium]
MKELIRLAYLNFLRNKRRSIISGTSIAIAITLIIFIQSYINGIKQNISDNVVRLLCGHIRITTKEYERRERLNPLSESIELSSDLYKALESDHILQISPRIKFGVLLGREDLNISGLGYGIDPEKEKKISKINERIIQGSYLDTVGNSVILGNKLAERLHLKINDTITLLTKTAYDSPAGINLIVKGIFSIGIGGFDRSVFYIPLKTAQDLLDLNGRATEIIIIVDQPVKSAKIAKQIKLNSNYSIIPFQQNPLVNYFNSFGIVLNIIYFIIILVACSTIANTMLMVVFERTKEIGMLKAMGMENNLIIMLLIFEAGLIGTVGSMVGAITGGILSYLMKYQGLDLSKFTSTTSIDMPYGPIIYFSPTFIVIITCLLFGIFATIIVAALPASRAAKLEPSKALRSI